MNWAWATSLDEIWRSPDLPMWTTLAAAGLFGLILLITLVRAEKSVANGALTVITLLAIGVAVAATMRIYGPAGQTAPGEARAQAVAIANLPALSCLDGLAGDAVLAGCEKALFGSPDAAAAAVSYTAARIDRLAALGDAASADKNLTPDTKALRKSLERDRYGLVAQVLVARDGCTQFDCAIFRSLTDQQRVAANMDAHLYDTLVARYAPAWNAPAATPAMPPSGALAALPTTMPTRLQRQLRAHRPRPRHRLQHLLRRNRPRRRPRAHRQPRRFRSPRRRPRLPRLRITSSSALKTRGRPANAGACHYT
jgi:hypothetical protein